MRLENKVALISGGARGIGAATAQLFCKEGATIVIGDILEQQGAKLVNHLNQQGANTLFTKLDVSAESDWQRTIELVSNTFNKIDILVNTAGVYPRISIDDTDVETWDYVMRINARGTFLGTKYVAGVMKKALQGSIINFASIGANIAGSNSSAYTASKGAVRLFTKAAAVEYAPFGIRVNSVHPGYTATDMTKDIFVGEVLKDREKNTLTGRLAQPIEIAQGVVFLASDEASYVTGSELIIDGGVTSFGSRA
jgi:cyclopentanol dehydrogenase